MILPFLERYYFQFSPIWPDRLFNKDYRGYQRVLNDLSRTKLSRPLYNFSVPLPPSLVRNLDWLHTERLRKWDILLTGEGDWRGGGEGGKRSQIIRRRESLILHTNSILSGESKLHAEELADYLQHCSVNLPQSIGSFFRNTVTSNMFKPLCFRVC